MQCCREREIGSSASGATSPLRDSRSIRRASRVRSASVWSCRVHADALAFLLQGFGKLQRALPQSLLAGAGFCLDNGRALRLLGRLQSEEIGRQQVGDDAGAFDIVHRIDARFCDEQESAAMIVPCTFIGTCRRLRSDCSTIGRLKAPSKWKRGSDHGVVCKEKIHLAPEQRADGAVDYGRAGKVAPGGLDARLIGRVVVATLKEYTDIEMVVRDYMGDLGRDRTDGRAEIELAREQPGNAEIVVEHGCGCEMQHFRFLPETAQAPQPAAILPSKRRGRVVVLHKPAACFANPANDLLPRPCTGRSISRILPLLRGGSSVQEQFSLGPIWAG